ncbi:MAG: LysM peptidoglycan-binding domain-containing protein [Anaerolineae bacterium]|nr:LysM peptidoglycan-binding domain-containing protein [Anaerolineae bacterium]NUQ02561.1 LysM peptidoglycan-binding domain-containing protein [Anaerolineae bacterium]
MILTHLLFIVLTSWHVLAQDVPGIAVHVVQRGENLYRISLQYGLTVDQIADANGISNPDAISVGQRLLIPPPNSAEESVLAIVHIVQPGETLESIGALYQINEDILGAANRITSSAEVYVGQTLIIPGAEIASAAAAIDAESASPGVEESSSADVSEVLDPTRLMVHIVQRGESLFEISKKYGVSVNDLIQANQFADPSLIYPGQELVIPGVSPPQYAGVLPQPIERLTIMPLIFVEGRSARIDFATTEPVSVQGQFLNRSLHAISQNGGRLHSMLIAVPLGTVEGVYPLTLIVTGSSAAMPFEANVQVNPGGYHQESLTLAADQLGLIDADVDAAEMAIVRQVMSGFSAERTFGTLFGLPAAAPLSSPFGNHRTYNGGIYENTHTGTDFAAPAGAPVFAPASGRVVLADTLNVRGVATILDHGWGVYTGYWHQTERYVNLGDFVEEGQMIGTVGSTGRATGAHLHWELWIDGVPVDPMQWVSEPLGY